MTMDRSVKTSLTDFKCNLDCNVAVSSGGTHTLARISAWAFTVWKTTVIHKRIGLRTSTSAEVFCPYLPL